MLEHRGADEDLASILSGIVILFMHRGLELEKRRARDFHLWVKKDWIRTMIREFKCDRSPTMSGIDYHRGLHDGQSHARERASTFDEKPDILADSDCFVSMSEQKLAGLYPIWFFVCYSNLFLLRKNFIFDIDYLSRKRFQKMLSEMERQSSKSDTRTVVRFDLKIPLGDGL